MVGQGSHRRDAALHLVLMNVQVLVLHLQLMVAVPVFIFKIPTGLTKAKHSQQLLHSLSKGTET